MEEAEAESKPGTYPNLDDVIVGDDAPTLLLPCIVCNKTFRPEVLQRHSKVCEKNTTKKRKIFDSFKQRVQGTELAEFLPFSSLQKRISVSEKPLSSNRKSSHWKECHEAFVTAIRAARGEGTDARGGSGEPRSLLRPSDHEQCPYCERHFGPKAFDRHQEWCREHHSRHPPITASSQAKERLEARIKYRAPPLKSKRAITREKYSPLVQRKVVQVSPCSSASGSATSSAGSFRHTSQSQQEQSNRLSKSGNSLSGRSQSKDVSNSLGFNRGMAGRTSLRASQRATRRSTSPGKRDPACGKPTITSPSQRFSLEDTQTENYDKEDMMVTSSSMKKISRNQTIKPLETKVDLQKPKIPKKPSLSSILAPKSEAIKTTKTEPLQMEVNSKESQGNSNLSKNPKNEQLWSGSHCQEPYDPYASAERQMMELLRSESACNINQGRANQVQKCNTQKHNSPSPAPSLSPMPSPTHSPKPSPLETSPASAFTRYAKDSDFSNQVQIEIESAITDKSQDSNVREALSENQADSHSQLTKLPVVSDQVISENELLVDPPLQPKLQLEKSTTITSTSPEPHSEMQLQIQPQPQPPPRLNKRSAQQSNDFDDLIVCGTNLSLPKLKTSHSLETAPSDFNNTDIPNLDNRPKTYDVESHSNREDQEKCGWFNTSDQTSLGDFDIPTIMESRSGEKIEVLNLENRDLRIDRRETRESREIREITEQDPRISDIDNLLEEVVRMQRSVSMLSEIDSVDNKEILPMPDSVDNTEMSPMPLPQSPSTRTSARSRRNRTGKMHIEDFLFPAELLERENNNFRPVADYPERSSSVFGSTKSRKSASKGRRLIEDMLFPPGADFNANTHNNNEDGDVVVSANALTGSNMSYQNFSPKIFPQCSTSPVPLTSKAPINRDDGDGIPRPKPLSLSTHSNIGNGCSEGNDVDPTLVPISPMQHQNQSQQSNSSRLSADSAYSSLNRRSPVPHVRRQCGSGMPDNHHHGAESPQSVLSQSFTQSLVMSSSGSESSLPPLLASQSSKRGSRSKHDRDTPSSDIGSATTPLLPKLSKFCHQCGTKFLVTVSKFCHECGAARLEIC